MGRLGILFFNGPYQAESAETVCKLASTALDKGHEVRIFCYMDAVNAALENQKDIEGIYNIEKGFKEILEKGATIISPTTTAYQNSIFFFTLFYLD